MTPVPNRKLLLRTILRLACHLHFMSPSFYLSLSLLHQECKVTAESAHHHVPFRIGPFHTAAHGPRVFRPNSIRALLELLPGNNPQRLRYATSALTIKERGPVAHYDGSKRTKSPSEDPSGLRTLWPSSPIPDSLRLGVSVPFRKCCFFVRCVYLAWLVESRNLRNLAL